MLSAASAARRLTAIPCIPMPKGGGALGYPGGGCGRRRTTFHRRTAFHATDDDPRALTVGAWPVERVGVARDVYHRKNHGLFNKV